MIKSSIEKIAEDIGFDIGMSDDIVQSDLLNGFCRAMANSMQKHQLETQICSIVDKLNDKSMMLIKELALFIELKEKQ